MISTSDMTCAKNTREVYMQSANPKSDPRQPTPALPSVDLRDEDIYSHGPFSLTLIPLHQRFDNVMISLQDWLAPK